MSDDRDRADAIGADAAGRAAAPRASCARCSTANADRHAKARAPHRACDPRLHGGLRASSPAGSCVYAVTPDSHAARRARRADAVATARPDILDRNGEILATDVRRPRCSREPQRLIDVDEAVELLTAVLPDLDATRGARAARHRSAASSGSSARSRRSSSRKSTGSAFRASASSPRTSASIRTAPRSRT